MVPAFGIIYTRFLNLVFLIGAIIYMRFVLSKDYLYIRAGGGSFNNIYIYLNTFGVTVAESINVRMAGKTSLR